MYRDQQTGQVVNTYSEIRALRPDVSFPASMTDADALAAGFDPVVLTTPPAFNRLTQKVREVLPVQVNGVWTQQWVIDGLEPAEQQAASAALQQEVVDAVQKRLDDFAKTRHYDGILSAATYATSPATKFAQEGQYCVAARDATWAALYALMAEVEAGTKPAPTSYADVAPQLPTLTWPS